jgi:hypothetical protein
MTSGAGSFLKKVREGRRHMLQKLVEVCHPPVGRDLFVSASRPLYPVPQARLESPDAITTGANGGPPNALFGGISGTPLQILLITGGGFWGMNKSMSSVQRPKPTTSN